MEDGDCEYRLPATQYSRSLRPGSFRGAIELCRILVAFIRP